MRGTGDIGTLAARLHLVTEIEVAEPEVVRAMRRLKVSTQIEVARARRLLIGVTTVEAPEVEQCGACARDGEDGGAAGEQARGGERAVWSVWWWGGRVCAMGGRAGQGRRACDGGRADKRSGIAVCRVGGRAGQQRGARVTVGEPSGTSVFRVAT